MILVKYNKKNRDIYCKCGGPVFVDGQGYHEIPIGFGFHKNDPNFRVDKIRFYGWIGECEKCKKQVLSWTSKKIISKVVKFK